MENIPTVHDTLILVDEYCENPPRRVNIGKVTKAGWVRYTKPDGTESETIKPHRYGGYWKGFRVVLHRDTPSKFEELTAKFEEYLKRKEEKRVKEKKWTKAYEDRRLNELNEVKLRLGGDYDHHILHRTLVGDDRLLTLSIPVKPDMVERKGDFEILIIRLRTGKKFDYRDTESVEVEGFLTYVNKNTSSFASCSGERGPTDEAVIWEIIRYAYNNW